MPRIWLAAVIFLGMTHSIAAGPCSADIERMQGLVDTHLREIEAKGPSAPESVDARLHHQPTPESIAHAEQRAGNGAASTKAIAALDQARTADRRGDTDACRKELSNARKFLD